MSITAHTPAATSPATDPLRRISRAAGILYLLTFSSTPTLALYQGVRDRADFVLGAGARWELSLGVHLIVKGFRPSAVAALPPAQAVR